MCSIPWNFFLCFNFILGPHQSILFCRPLPLTQYKSSLSVSSFCCCCFFSLALTQKSFFTVFLLKYRVKFLYYRLRSLFCFLYTHEGCTVELTGTQEFHCLFHLHPTPLSYSLTWCHSDLLQKNMHPGLIFGRYSDACLKRKTTMNIFLNKYKSLFTT